MKQWIMDSIEGGSGVVDINERKRKPNYIGKEPSAPTPTACGTDALPSALG
jgi:hypothetical protein